MRYLTEAEIRTLQRRLIAQSGGSPGLRDAGILASAVAQPQMSFGGEDLYPSLIEKAAALGFSLIQNHAFVDGNKRIGHAAMAVFLLLNGHEIQATVDEQEEAILSVAAGRWDREALVVWLQEHVVPRTQA